jgi:RHS repeat-associated protein
LSGAGLTTDNPATSLLYSGERTDAITGLQDLRSRSYDAGNGRFTSADSFAGWLDEPTSLHRYGYCAGNRPDYQPAIYLIQSLFSHEEADR